VTALAATIGCAIACAALVAAEWRGAAAARAIAKLAASAAFLVVAASVDAGRAHGGWTLAGLALGAAGDAFLLGRGHRMFLGGLIAFLLGHLAYVAGLAALVPPARWPGAAGAYAALPIAAGLAALARLWPRLGRLRGPVILYVAAIAAMVVGALAALGDGALPAPQRTYLAAGAALFFVSDLAVARDRFIARELANRAWGLPAYYAGQLLIAWSIG
jgi:uncharacterized membrane protein YhhN